MDIQLAIAVGRVAELEQELLRTRLLVPVKKERCTVSCQTSSVKSFDGACQTDRKEYFTDTGTLIDGDEEDYQAWLLQATTEEALDHTVVEEDVEIVYMEDEGGDVLFAVGCLHPHFMGLTQRMDGDVLSLQWLREYCDELPFAYDDDEIREHSHWLLLLYYLEARAPFTRTLTVHQRYGGQREWCVERRYHFHFSVG